MSLIAKHIPPVSLEFAKELQARFKPYDVKPGFDRDKLMESIGEQKVIKWILFHAQNSVSKSTIDILDNNIDKDKIENTEVGTIVELTPTEERKTNWFERFTSRFGN